MKEVKEDGHGAIEEVMPEAIVIRNGLEGLPAEMEQRLTEGLGSGEL